MRRLSLLLVPVFCISLTSCPGGPTFRVTYLANGGTGGTVPVDGTLYRTGDVVTVLSNSGGLNIPCRALAAWNTQADGGGTDLPEGSTFVMGASDVTLHARWRPYFTLNHYFQCDAAWASEIMGSGPDTICASGSLLTSLAMMLSAEDKTATPKTLDDYLAVNGGYSSGSFITYAAMDGYGTSFTSAGTSAFSLAALKSELDLGNPVPVLRGGAAWCVVTEYANQGTQFSDFHFLDPGDASADLFVLDAADNPTTIAAFHR